MNLKASLKMRMKPGMWSVTMNLLKSTWLKSSLILRPVTRKGESPANVSQKCWAFQTIDCGRIWKMHEIC